MSVSADLTPIRYDEDAASISEPATLTLLGMGLAGLGFSRRARKR